MSRRALGRRVAGIVITGFMATGKSTVGRRVADRLGRRFVDTDVAIEARAGKPVARIFAEDGETRFRALEREAVASACATPDAVIAVGGGALVDPENRRALAAVGPIVCLEATPEEILRRVGDARTRPLLASAPDRLGRIRELLAARAEIYATATHRVDTTGIPPDDVAARVCAAVERPPDAEVVVELGARSYPVVVGSGLLASVGRRLAALGYRGPCGLVMTDRLLALQVPAVEASLRAADLVPVTVAVPDGEEHKTPASVALIHDRLLAAGLDRSSVVVALGGGVVGDLAGFAAATLLRGVAVVQLPTTLLAMVDAAIGGKTGVNHARGKNLIGAFHQPRFVLADVDTLGTLPPRELRAGMAEVVKYGVIRDPALFASLERDAGALQALERAPLVATVAACARHKAAVVSADEYERSGERAVLNFGHTVGHGVESLTDYTQFLHGEAVAIGMVAAARVSRAIGCCGPDVPEAIARVLQRHGLPTELPVEPRRLIAAMRSDKKSAAGRIKFVAVEAIGRTRLVDLTAEEIVRHL